MIRIRLIRMGIPLAALAAGVGAGLMWKRWRIPVRETQVDVPATVESPHALTPGVFGGDRPLQLMRDGTGPLFHRVYQADIQNPTLSKEALIDWMKRDPNHFTPPELARFDKTKGDPEVMALADEYYITISAPWDGPVRVIDVTPTSFSFITLDEHLEAGEIQFRAIDHPDRPDAIRFEIRSWARSKDMLVDLSYRVTKLARAAQTGMWVFFCDRAVEASGGTLIDKINVTTHEVPYEDDSGQPAPLWKQYADQIERLRGVHLNFDPSLREKFVEADGWRFDSHKAGLPSEVPGKPVPNGSFEAAKQILLNYEFPDPSIISGIFVPDEPLEQRTMLLRAHFAGFTFYFGARISQVIDGMQEDPVRGEATVWGYGYQTLQGHWEMGEIVFEVWKFMTSGEVEFRIRAYSKVGFIPNPFYRLGFALFGRRIQLRFAHTALKRMQQLVLARLAKVETPVETPEVQPVEASPKAEEKLETLKTESRDPLASNPDNA